jgi:hypothetical protein
MLVRARDILSDDGYNGMIGVFTGQVGFAQLCYKREEERA